MTFIRKIGNRNVVCRRLGNKRGQIGKKFRSIYGWFVVKYSGCYRVSVGDIVFPESWKGKRIRIIVEEVER